MRFRSILPSCMLSRRASAGLGLVVLTSMFGVTGCVSYKLTGVYVEPSAGVCIVPGSTAQFTAYGTYTEGGHTTKTQDITDEVSWSTGLSELATVNSSGLASAGTDYLGYTDVKASTQGEFGLIWSSAQLTVSDDCNTTSPAVVRPGMRILPGDQNLESVGDTTQLVAVGHYPSSPWSRDLSQEVKWTSSNPEVATVTAEGLVTAVRAGQATMTATQTTEQGTVVTATEKIVVGGASSDQ
jgi:trimeric autotransporter adhesin